MKRLLYSTEAISNLKSIFDHTQKNFSKDKATEVIDSIFNRVESLEKYHYLGGLSDLSGSIRELVVLGNSIYYQVTEAHIESVYIKPRKTKPKR